MISICYTLSYNGTCFSPLPASWIINISENGQYSYSKDDKWCDIIEVSRQKCQPILDLGTAPIFSFLTCAVGKER